MDCKCRAPKSYLGTHSKVTVRSRSNWNLGMLVFVEGEKPEYREITLGARTRTNNKLNPWDPETRNRTSSSSILHSETSPSSNLYHLGDSSGHTLNNNRRNELAANHILPQCATWKATNKIVKAIKWIIAPFKDGSLNVCYISSLK